MKTKTILSTLLIALFCGGLSLTTNLVKQNDVQPTLAYTTGDGATYYNSISDTLEGTDLINALNSLNASKLQHRVGYDTMKTAFSQTDYDPSKGKGSDYLLSFYSGKSAVYKGNMNREHVWPASRTVLGRNNDPLEDDIHMVRPTLTSENSARGNNFFAAVGAWDPASFNNESYRGDAARIILYCAIADTRLTLVDRNTDDTANHTMGKLSDLLEWNLKYPVSQREKNRNEGAEGLQGNRNPFIDHPEYGCRIWGGKNDKTREICQKYADDQSKIHVTSVSLDQTSATLEVGETLSLTPTVSPSNATDKTVTWSSTNNAIAAVKDGVVTAKGEGTATIRATSVDKTSIYGECVITVKKAEFTATFSSNGGTGAMDSITSVNKKITLPNCSFSSPSGKEFDYWQVGENQYQPGDEITLSNDITITAIWKDAAIKPMLVKIVVSGVDKTSFKQNEQFDKGNLKVTATYSDGSIMDVTDKVQFILPNMSVAGEVEVRIYYEEDGVTKATSYKINIAGGGCSSSLVASTGLVSLVSILGLALLVIKRK